MELKKYVLLEKKEILDTTEEIYYLKGENELYRDRPKAVLVTVFIGRVLKTSDNILDLVEPCTLWDADGDLVEYNIGDKVMIDKIFENANFSNMDIKAIYKKQPNGDYKRYEVKQ